MKSLADLIKEDLNVPDTDRASGYLLRKVIAWRAGNAGEALDASKKPIDPLDGNTVTEALLKPAVFEIISTWCKSNFMLLHPDNWKLFDDVDDKPVIERLLKKMLPLTHVDSIVTETGHLDPSVVEAPTWLQKNLARWFASPGAIALLTTTMDIVASQLDRVAWAMRVLVIIDATLQINARGHSWFLVTAANLLRDCKTTEKRRAFAGVLKNNGKSKELIDALLRAGSLSEDKGDDVLDLLGTMDHDAVAAFLKRDARVVHLNYFLRLHASRTEPLKKRKVPVARSKDGDKDSKLKELDDTIAFLGKRTDPESVALLASTRERRDILLREAWKGAAPPKVFPFLEMTNPWALDRQFTSWVKRISDATLDPDKINAMKGFITRHLDAARRAMNTSDELATVLESFFQPSITFDAAGARHVELAFEAMASPEVHPDVHVIITQAFPSGGPRPATIHLLDIGNASTLPRALPGMLKDFPWFMIHKGEIIGIGLSNSRLKAIPEALLKLSKLKILDLSNNVIKQVDALGSWPSLQYLDLSRNMLSSFAPGGPRSHVAILDLHCNVLKDVDVTFASKGLEVLDVSRNQITRMSQVRGLQACQKLKTLNLAWNKLDTLQDFPGMITLETLFLNGNGLVKLGNETTLPGVLHLDVSDNNFGALKGISNFPAVVHVDARRNYLKNVTEIDTMAHLQEFLASSNQIESPGDLLALKELRCLDLRSNPLSRVKKLEDKARFLIAQVQRHLYPARDASP